DRLRQRLAGDRLLPHPRPRPELRPSCGAGPVPRQPRIPARVTDLTSFVRARLPGARNLEQSELVELATAIGHLPDFWRPLVRHDPGERVYVQLYRDPHVDVWMICWLDD